MLERFIEQWRRDRLDNYRRIPADIREHVGIEDTVLAGGYGYRQIVELVQNGADAVSEASSVERGAPRDQAPRIQVLLSGDRLYVANTGAPLSQDGIEALLLSHSSPKRGNQIGRFGIGFKSLLRLGGVIDIFSRGISLRFDPDRCGNEIREACGLTPDHPAPALRLAWTLDREAEEATDPLLDRFCWATTVVRADIREPRMLPHIEQEIRAFPTQFLLFLPVPVTLELDAGDGEVRRLTRRSEDNHIVLADGEGPSRWRVIEREIRITDPDARRDATHLHQRDAVPLAWAIPLDAKREDAGRFWAFFPTETESRIPGILNAPWKLNSDRKSIIVGEWNQALMHEAARLIANTLPGLADASDPGRTLDYFPRQLSRQDEPAATLVETLWDQIADSPVIPDGAGTLRLARDLNRPPENDKDLMELWCALANQDARSRWIHPTNLEGDRKSRLSELAKRVGKMATSSEADNALPRLSSASAAVWFGEIASTEIVAAKAVIGLAKDFSNAINQGSWESVRPTLAIIPSKDGILFRPSDVLVVPPGQDVPGRSTVADELVADEDSRGTLIDILKVRSLLSANWEPIISQALKAAVESGSDGDWRTFWQTLRCATLDEQIRFVRNKNESILILRQDATWTHRDAVLLPGKIVPKDDQQQGNLNALADLGFHEGDPQAFEALGVSEVPPEEQWPIPAASIFPGGSVPREDIRTVLKQWRSFAVEPFACRPMNQQPYPTSYSPDFDLPAGFVLLSQLSGLANANLSWLLLGRVGAFPPTLTFKHFSRPEKYPISEIEHPLRWLLSHHGLLGIGVHTIPIRTILARIESPIFERLTDWKGAIPILRSMASAASSHPTRSTLAILWKAMAEHLATPERIRDGDLADLWNGAAADGWVPEALPWPDGVVSLAEVYVTGSADLARRGRERGRLVVELDEVGRDLWLEQGAQSLDEAFKVDWDEPMAPVGLLQDAIPETGVVLAEDQKHRTYTQSVQGLHLRIDHHPDPVACVHWQNVLYLDPGQLADLTCQDRLLLVLREASTAGWLVCGPDEALLRIADATLDDRRAEVAAAATLAERLLMAVAGNVDALLAALGVRACSALSPDAQPVQVAELALALLGPTVLQTLSEALSASGLRPPTRWGTAEARAFVLELGFPEAFAVSQTAGRDAELWVSGPIHLPILHDYQEAVVAGLRSLIQSGSGRRRAVVSLPTGGGKTRVTVQAAVELVLTPPGPRRSVLWIAQTDELCEQAVQSFRQVWLNRGAQATDLRVVRLWGGAGNPSAPAAGEPTVVAASIQTLNSRIDHETLRWLRTPGLVVVDECHHAITKSYTGVLRWLDALPQRPGAPAKEEPPFIGLSATPFRGIDDDESERLAARFDRRWLPENQRDLYARLLTQRVLAHADHEPLESNATVSADLFDLLEDLDDTVDDIRLDGVGGLFERVNQELATNDSRNALLLKTIAESDAGSILFFTNSVGHALEMAARLCVSGIPAAAVSGDTPRAARRWFLDRFQSGALRVLCNYSVLTTGFDAPKTDLVLIARQVKSPVRYMQMVGRGLRGPANGGTERCRIVTVLDNLGRFGNRQPFDFCSKFYVSG